MAFDDPKLPVQPFLYLRTLTICLLLLFLAVEVVVVADWLQTRGADRVPARIDFEIFHLVGGLVWQGRLEDAYLMQKFLGIQGVASDGKGFMPWTYPPPFDLVAASLAMFPMWLAYLAFIWITLATYLLVLRRVAAEQFATVFVGILPLLFVNILVGQNGFLTGALIGLFAWLALRDHPLAGVPLGLMVIKPHLALGIILYLLVMRRWVWITQAAVVALGLGILSTIVLGPGIWFAFLDGVGEAGDALEQGRYPLHRMTSVYAGLRSLGLDAQGALAVHFAVALGALVLIPVAVAQSWRDERTLALVLLATLMVSPYNYDYDLTTMTFVLALVLRTASEPGSRRLFPAVLAMGLFVGTYPLAISMVPSALVTQAHLAGDDHPYSLAPFVFTAMAILILLMMWRGERADAARSTRGIPANLTERTAP